jgi:hypothetical protein
MSPEARPTAIGKIILSCSKDGKLVYHMQDTCTYLAILIQKFSRRPLSF